jgi:hypothetical protein
MTSLHADCTAGPLPAIRLFVAPDGTVAVRRATVKATNVKQCLAAELPPRRFLSKSGLRQRRDKPLTGNDK